MNFEAGSYEPFPLSSDRSETPLPTFDPSHPFTGIELLVSGLSLDSFLAASEHLKERLDKLRHDGLALPPLQITSPANIQPLDFVYVSLAGPLQETP